jgi:hypothetical protein
MALAARSPHPAAQAEAAANDRPRRTVVVQTDENPRSRRRGHRSAWSRDRGSAAARSDLALVARAMAARSSSRVRRPDGYGGRHDRRARGRSRRNRVTTALLIDELGRWPGRSCASSARERPGETTAPSRALQPRENPGYPTIPPHPHTHHRAPDRSARASKPLAVPFATRDRAREGRRLIARRGRRRENQPRARGQELCGRARRNDTPARGRARARAARWSQSSGLGDDTTWRVGGKEPRRCPRAIARAPRPGMGRPEGAGADRARATDRDRGRATGQREPERGGWRAGRALGRDARIRPAGGASASKPSGRPSHQASRRPDLLDPSPRGLAILVARLPRRSGEPEPRGRDRRQHKAHRCGRRARPATARTSRARFTAGSSSGYAPAEDRTRRGERRRRCRRHTRFDGGRGRRTPEDDQPTGDG